MKNQSWGRLCKNITTLIVLVILATFFYVYKPQKEMQYDVATQDSIPESADSIIALYDTIINPNTATIDEFLRVGFTKKQATSCINYRMKGGVFYKKEDVKKIYTVSEEDYEKLKEYIYVPYSKPLSLKQNQTKKIAKKNKEEFIVQININDCDTNDLKNLPKIGGFRARKIIERRDKLGGYYSLSQLYSVYSMDSSIVQCLEKYLIFNPNQIQKININSATFKEINRHPLISYGQTKVLCNYRKIVGTIQTIEELRDNNIVTADEYEILKFYLKTID